MLRCYAMRSHPLSPPPPLPSVKIMYPNGVTHEVVANDQEGMQSVIDWLNYTPKVPTHSTTHTHSITHSSTVIIMTHTHPCTLTHRLVQLHAQGNPHCTHILPLSSSSRPSIMMHMLSTARSQYRHNTTLHLTIVLNPTPPLHQSTIVVPRTSTRWHPLLPPW